jgi:hypothetical protein
MIVRGVMAAMLGTLVMSGLAGATFAAPASAAAIRSLAAQQYQPHSHLYREGIWNPVW